MRTVTINLFGQTFTFTASHDDARRLLRAMNSATAARDEVCELEERLVAAKSRAFDPPPRVAMSVEDPDFVKPKFLSEPV